MPKQATNTSTSKKDIKVDQKLFHFIPQESAELYKMIPMALTDKVLRVGMVDVKNTSARDALNFITINQGLTYEVEKITKAQFEEVLEQYTSINNEMNDALNELEEQSEVVLGIEEEDVSGNPEEFLREEAPVIKLVSTILAQAVKKGASDVHIEPEESRGLVRYRLDGVLTETLQFPKKVHDSLVARIKILSNLRLDERRRPQDGRFTSSIRENRIDFRVATFPTSNGEKVVLRVLDKQKGLKTLNELGLDEGSHKKILSSIKRPYGLILATGPTGAGKTTTLYALLNLADRTSKNIVSLEDPVEYRLDGVNQSNIRPEIGYTFATGLRSILRSDPDEILVGEIRDKETAQLAIQAALTGHLVYSTLHTNTAVGAISRLLNFGIEPFLLAPTISLIIGQRMLRKLDGDGKDVEITPAMKSKLEEEFADLPQVSKSSVPEFKNFKDPVATGTNPSGMKGRVGIFEVLNINEEIRSIILSNPDETEIYKAARKTGYMTMSEDAIIKGLNGIVPASEVYKATNEKLLHKSKIKIDEETDFNMEEV